jgi:hypothetical protein
MPPVVCAVAAHGNTRQAAAARVAAPRCLAQQHPHFVNVLKGTTMTTSGTSQTVGQRSWVVALILCFFLGVIGVHRFYVGKVGTGILQIVTFGGLGLWVLIDFIMILAGKFSDKQGQSLAR